MKPDFGRRLPTILAVVSAMGLLIAAYLYTWAFRSTVADLILAVAALAVFIGFYSRIMAHAVVAQGPLQVSLREILALVTAAGVLGSLNHAIDAILILVLTAVAYCCALLFRKPALRIFPLSITKQLTVVHASALAVTAMLTTVASSVFVVILPETATRNHS